MSEEKLKIKSIEFLQYVMQFGLLQTDLTDDEMYESFLRKDECYSESVNSIDDEDN